MQLVVWTLHINNSVISIQHELRLNIRTAALARHVSCVMYVCRIRAFVPHARIYLVYEVDFLVTQNKHKVPNFKHVH